jgi:hypothetical protein
LAGEMGHCPWVMEEWVHVLVLNYFLQHAVPHSQYRIERASTGLSVALTRPLEIARRSPWVPMVGCHTAASVAHTDAVAKASLRILRLAHEELADFEQTLQNNFECLVDVDQSERDIFCRV